MKHRTVRTLSIWTLRAALALACVSQASPSGAQEPSRLSVTAQGYASRVPDRAWIRFEVSIEAKSPPGAIDGTAAAIKQLLDQLGARGIASKNLQTAALALRPKFEVRREGQREIRGDLLGYVASKSIVATIEDLSLVPSFIREFPLAGSVRIADVGFFSTGAEAAQSEALVDAIRRAQEAAQIAVNAAGRKLGPVTSMEVTIAADRLGPPRLEEHRYVYQTPAEIAGARLIVEPGEQQFNQNISLQWHLQ
jgi:uncharacterized protein YggE